MTLDGAESRAVVIPPERGCEPAVSAHFRAVAVEPERRARWYCVITKPMQEERAAKELRRQGFDVMCPMIEPPARHKHLDRRKMLALAAKLAKARKAKPAQQKPHLVPAFRRYLLVRFDVALDPWGVIRSTRGVDSGEGKQYILCMRPGVPFPIPDRQVEAMQVAIMQGGKKADGVEALIRAGTQVEILAGPFTSFRGPVLEVEKDGVVVQAWIFGRPCKVWLPNADVARL